MIQGDLQGVQGVPGVLEVPEVHHNRPGTSGLGLAGESLEWELVVRLADWRCKEDSQHQGVAWGVRGDSRAVHSQGSSRGTDQGSHHWTREGSSTR